MSKPTVDSHQASPLTCKELAYLHALVFSAADVWDAIFAGSVLFMTYARSRWTDGQHVERLSFEHDPLQKVAFIEGAVGIHKTSRASQFRHAHLPLTAFTDGVLDDGWAETWQSKRLAAGIQDPPSMPLMPAPNVQGSPTVRPLSTMEAGEWLKRLLLDGNFCLDNRRITSHTMKCTVLSFAAKRGISLDDRSCGASWFLFTDGACEGAEPIRGSIGGVLYNQTGQLMFHFSEVVPDEVMNQLLEESKHPIYELEILPVLVAAVVWGECFRNAQVVCYVDNEGAKSSLLKGTGYQMCWSLR